MLFVAALPILSKYAKSRTFPARQVQRANIILLAAAGLNNMQICGRNDRNTGAGTQISG